MPLAPQPLDALPSTGSQSPSGEIAILWLTAGLSCDGDTIAMTAATQPSPHIQSVRPGMRTVRVSAKTGAGMVEYLSLLEAEFPVTREATATGAS